MAIPEIMQSSNSEAAGLDRQLKVREEDVLALPLFHNVEREIAAHLAAECTYRQYPVGTVLMKQGDAVPVFRIVLHGLVEMLRMDEEHAVGALLLSSKDLIMPSAAVFDEPTLVSVRTLTAVKILEMDAGLVRSAVQRCNQLSWNLMAAMSGQWRMALRNILELNSRTAAQRLGRFLLKLVKLQANAPSPILPIPKQTLAVRLGIAPETLSRTLQIVADHGLHLRGREIIVRDRAQIEEFCGPSLNGSEDEQKLDVFVL